MDQTEQSELASIKRASAINIAAAQSAVEKLTREYPAAARKNLKAARDQFAEKAAVDPEGEYQELRVFAHNFTGQGASFNYPLVSEIADSLRLYLRSCSNGAGMEPQFIEAHFGAIQDVLEKECAGEGGEEGHAILERLKGFMASAG